MKTILILLICSVSFAQNPFIEVDQFGYFTTGTKVAVLRNPQTGFNAAESYTAPATLQVKNSSNIVVYTVNVTTWNSGNTDAISGDKGWWFDFSSVTTPGTYYIYDATNAKSSATFQIATNPYTEVLKTATKMFYYNRCNFSKTVPYANIKWTDATNFNNNLQDYNARSVFAQSNAATEKDLSGGWFDAGDYNKYVTFTDSVIHDLLIAYESNPAIFGDNWNIPESGNNVPDILDELKYELDWLYKMSNADGSAYIKMGSKNYSQNFSSPPSANIDPRYYGNLCTSASATIASTFSHAAIIFNSIGNTAYATQLQNRAIACFNYTLPYFNANTLQTNCDNGEIVSGDADVSITEQKTMMISAAIYLYKLTNLATYNTFVTTNASIITPLSDSNWGADYTPVQDALLYYTSLPNATPSLVNTITNSAQNDVTNNWNNFYGISNLGLYRDYMPQWAYYWGSNRIKAKYGNLNLLYAKYNIGSNTNNLKNRAKEFIHSFHGVNPLGIVQLSNMYDFGADYSINEMYHQWFTNGSIYDNALTSAKGPAPGYLVGGPNKDFSVASLSPPYGQPPTKSYLDFNDGYPNNSWEVSEPAINNQAAYVRLLAGVISNFDTSLSNDSFENKIDYKVDIYPNPSNGEFDINSNNVIKNVKAFDILGKEIKVDTLTKNKYFIDKSGIYFIKIELNNNAIVNKKIIVK